MTKPSKVQREILGLMAQGHQIYEYEDRRLDLMGRVIQQQTYRILHKQKWIQDVALSFGSKSVYEITDAGREALGEET